MNIINRFKGITIIGVLISMVILALGVVTLVKFQGDLLQGLSTSNQQSQAIALAQNKIDELRHFVVLDTTSGSTAYEDISSGSQVIISNNTTFTINWLVTEVADPPHKVVRVTVSWTDQKGSARSIVLESIIGRSDPATSGKTLEGI